MSTCISVSVLIASIAQRTKSVVSSFKIGQHRMSTSIFVSLLITLIVQRTSSLVSFRIAIIFDELDENYLRHTTSQYDFNITTSSTISLEYFIDEYKFIQQYYSTDDGDFRKWHHIIIDLRESFDETLCRLSHLNNLTYVVLSAQRYRGCPITTKNPVSRNYLHLALRLFAFGDEIPPPLILFTEQWQDDDSTTRTQNTTNVELLLYSLSDEDGTEISTLLTDKIIQWLVFLGPYEQLQNLTNMITLEKYKGDDQILIIPTDSISCPNISISYICFQDTRYQDKLQFKYRLYKQMMEFLQSCLQQLIDNITDEKSVFNTLKEALTRELSQNILQNNEITDINIVRVDPYNVSSITNMIGTWSYTDGIQLTEKPFPDVPPATLSVTLLNEPPFVNREITANGIRYSGYTVDVWEEIAKRLNLNYKYREPADGQYGAQLSDGSWTGAVGEVATGVTDVGAGAISVTAERESVIDFSAPYFDYAGLQILMKNPDTTLSVFVFTSIFSEQVWATWFAILFLTGAVIYIFHRLQNKTFAKNMNPKPINLFNLKDSYWFVMASIALAGPERSPVTPSSRLLVAGFWFFCELIMATYTANLAAFLTSSRLETPIYSLEDLATQNIIKHSVIAGSSGETYFKRMSDIEDNFYTLWRDMSYATSPDVTITKYAVWDYPLGDKYMRLWNNMKYVKNSEEGLSRVLEGNFVFFQETPVLEYDMMRHCGLITVGKPFSSKPYAFVLPQRSPLVKQVSNIILQLQSETLLTKFKNKWWKNGTSPCVTGIEGSGLSFYTLGGIFIVMSVGCGLGLITLGIESIIATYSSYRQRLKRVHENAEIDDEPTTSKAKGEEFYHLNETLPSIQN